MSESTGDLVDKQLRKKEMQGEAFSEGATTPSFESGELVSFVKDWNLLRKETNAPIDPTEYRKQETQKNRVYPSEASVVDVITRLTGKDEDHLLVERVVLEKESKVPLDIIFQDRDNTNIFYQFSVPEDSGSNKIYKIEFIDRAVYELEFPGRFVPRPGAVVAGPIREWQDVSGKSNLPQNEFYDEESDQIVRGSILAVQRGKEWKRNVSSEEFQKDDEFSLEDRIRLRSIDAA